LGCRRTTLSQTTINNAMATSTSEALAAASQWVADNS
jgi:hypothetical protein